MKTIDVDARRYAWCRSQATWRMGPMAQCLVEDLQGAVAEGQVGLARHVTRQLADLCAVTVALAEYHAKPVPPPNLRAAWALDVIQGHELAPECSALIRGVDDDEPLDQLLDRGTRLHQAVRDIVGDVPDSISPEGYFPALALARDWLRLLDAVGEEGFLPGEWTRS